MYFEELQNDNLRMIFLILIKLLLPSTCFCQQEYFNNNFIIHKDKTINSPGPIVGELYCDSVAVCAVECSKAEWCCRVSFNLQNNLCLLDSNCTGSLIYSADGIVMTKDTIGG